MLLLGSYVFNVIIFMLLYGKFICFQRALPVLIRIFSFKFLDYSDDEEEAKAKAVAKKKRQNEK